LNKKTECTLGSTYKHN